jgi:hypothetical protein
VGEIVHQFLGSVLLQTVGSPNGSGIAAVKPFGVRRLRKQTVILHPVQEIGLIVMVAERTVILEPMWFRLHFAAEFGASEQAKYAEADEN